MLSYTISLFAFVLQHNRRAATTSQLRTPSFLLAIVLLFGLMVRFLDGSVQCLTFYFFLTAHILSNQAWTSPALLISLQTETFWLSRLVVEKYLSTGRALMALCRPPFCSRTWAFPWLTTSSTGKITSWPPQIQLSSSTSHNRSSFSLPRHF